MTISLKENTKPSLPVLAKDNNFDLVRLTLSWIVVFVHLYQISGISEYAVFRQYLSSSFAVKGFFAISGYLVTLSYVNCNSLGDFAERRLRRIVPAYITIVLLSFLVGAVFTTLPVSSYFGSWQTWKYLFANSVFLNFLAPTLPGVFADHPEQAMNPALWTIKIELCLYFCVPIIVWGFRRVGVWPTTLILYLTSVAWLLGFKALGGNTNQFLVEISRQFPGQLSYFVFGAALAMAPLKRSWMFILTALTGTAWFLMTGLPRAIIEPAFFALIVITIATAIRYLGNFGRFGDLSYGTYIFHSLVIHCLLAWGVLKASPYLGAVMTTVIIAALAFCSWRWLEKPLLKRSKKVV
jgi:peptidoglycan/LPS O-acetylase OafA/YrhL